MANYCTTADILLVDPNAKNLTSDSSSTSDYFDDLIAFISSAIDIQLQQSYPGLTVSDLEDTSQLKIPCIYGCLEQLYRNATIHGKSAAHELAKDYARKYNESMKIRLDLDNGETIKPLSMKCQRG